MIILGIETSCDETGIGLVQAEHIQKPVKLLANNLASSLSLHAQTGGIIPEVAAREQLKYILPLLAQTLEEVFSQKLSQKPPPIDAIAVTYGPGLIGSLLVGLETAKTLAYVWQKPLVPVNHLFGHLYANWIDIQNKKTTPQFPCLGLVVSGGHTDLVLLKNHKTVKVLGSTRDDAAGEAFDKTGRLLGLSYPAGPQIAKIAQNGQRGKIKLPRPMLDSGDFDFSFSGLKTAVLNLVKKNNWENLNESKNPMHQKILADLAASIEEAVVDVLVKKTLQAVEKYKPRSFVLGGGVAANKYLNQRMQKALSEKLEIFIPPPVLCTDNAAMIAASSFYRYQPVSWQKMTVDPSLYF